MIFIEEELAGKLEIINDVVKINNDDINKIIKRLADDTTLMSECLDENVLRFKLHAQQTRDAYKKVVEEIEKMIIEEFRKHPMVDEVNYIEIPNPSVRGKYSTRLDIDETLDDINSIREKVKHYVNNEVFRALVEVGERYMSKK
jgi:hypothetical protein